MNVSHGSHSSNRKMNHCSTPPCSWSKSRSRNPRTQQRLACRKERYRFLSLCPYSIWQLDILIEFCACHEVQPTSECRVIRGRDLVYSRQQVWRPLNPAPKPTSLTSRESKLQRMTSCLLPCCGKKAVLLSLVASSLGSVCPANQVKPEPLLRMGGAADVLDRDLPKISKCGPRRSPEQHKVHCDCSINCR
jgi:hypothetical protein